MCGKRRDIEVRDVSALDTYGHYVKCSFFHNSSQLKVINLESTFAAEKRERTRARLLASLHCHLVMVIAMTRHQMC